MARLFAIPYSPWSEKARWALDHHFVPYEYVSYTPMLGEPALRLSLRRPLGRVSVPSLIDGELRLTDSFDIARHAERVGSGTRLFPLGHDDAIATWNTRSQHLLEAARTLTAAASLQSPEALDEALPSFLPGAVRPALRGVGHLGVAFLRAKYGGADTLVAAETLARTGLEQLRGALAARGAYLLGEFSYADIAMAVTLQCVRPADEAHWPLGPGMRKAWANPALAAEFSDLADWRDELYAKHRRS